MKLLNLGHHKIVGKPLDVSMDFKLLPAPEEHKHIIQNLMQFYIYDFTPYMDYDVEENGLFKNYPGLDDYWVDKDNKFPYIIKNHDKYIGFVLVKSEKNCFSVAEFFIMKKYRRKGIGKAMAERLFNLHRGQWEVHQRENNKPAQEFWISVINEYTKGQFTESFRDGRRIQNFKNYPTQKLN